MVLRVLPSYLVEEEGLRLIVHPLMIEAIVHRRTGKTERIVQPAHSPLKNWGRLLKALFDESTETITLEDGSTANITGTLYAKASGTYCNGGSKVIYPKRKISFKAGEGDNTFGFVVGYGTKPVEFDDFKLDSKYPHGETLSKIYYKGTNIFVDYSQQVTINNKTYNVMAIVVERTFENHADDSQKITEAGLMVYLHRDGATSYKFLVFRDVLDNPITLAPTEAVTLRYQLRWLIPA